MAQIIFFARMRIVFLFIFILNVIAFGSNGLTIKINDRIPSFTYGDSKQQTKWNQKTKKWIDSFTFCTRRFLSTTSSQIGEENDENKNHMESVQMGDDASVHIMQGPFSSQDFAKSKCWGKKPLLIRSAFDPLEVEQEFGKWPDKDDLAMLSYDEDAESR